LPTPPGSRAPAPPGRDASAEDADGDVDGATALEQLDRLVQVDVRPGGELESVGSGVARADESLGAPSLHALQLRLDYFVYSRHPHLSSVA